MNVPHLPHVTVNPFKALTVCIVFFSTVIGAVIQIDSRYVHQEDMTHFKKKISTIVIVQSTSARRKVIEDKLFELDARRSDSGLTAAENAEYNRYTRELNTLASTDVNELLAKFDDPNRVSDLLAVDSSLSGVVANASKIQTVLKSSITPGPSTQLNTLTPPLSSSIR